MTTLGEAWIEVHADTKPFAKELAAKLKMILAEVDKVAKAQAPKIGESIGDGVKKGFGKKEPEVRGIFRKFGNFLSNEGNRWERNLRETFTKMARGNFILTRVFGQAALAIGGATKRIFAFAKGLFNLGRGAAEVAMGIGQALVVGMQALFGVTGDAARAASTLSAGFARVGAALAAAAAEAVAAAPAIAAVAAAVFITAGAVTILAMILVTVAAPFAALIDLALALPAALTFLIAVIAPLIIAFKDLNEVMGLVFEKDPDRLKKGLAKLSPTMRGLVALLRGFSGEFKGLVDHIQHGFFEPIMHELGPALKALLPVLTGNLARIAADMGAMVASILHLVASRPVVEAMASMMGQIADFLERNSGVLVQVFAALGAAAQAALPIVLELLDKFSGFLTQFATWIMGAITDGSFERWLRTGIASLQSIWNLVKALIGLFATMFAKLNGDGRDFLKIITDAINRFTKWLRSPDGQTALENIGRLAKVAASAFAGALVTVQAILSVMNKIVKAWDWLSRHHLVPALPGSSSAGGWLSNVAGTIQNSFSGGGVVPEDQIAMVHAGEPILDPSNSVARNRSILADAGMLDVLSTATTVNVYIGSERLTERIDYQIAQNNRGNARALASGPRR